MSVKLKIAEPGEIYFITITCFKWLALFNIGSYDAVHKWFEYLSHQGMVRGHELRTVDR